MHMVNSAEAATVSGDVEADALVPPFREEEMVAPGSYCDI